MKVRFLLTKVLGWFYLLFGVSVVFILYPIIGFQIENGYFSLHDFLTADIHGNYRLTFGELILDVDNLLANFLTNVIFSLVFTFFCLNYGHSGKERELFGNSKAYRMRGIAFGVLSAVILTLAITFSVAGIGLDRPEFDGRELELMFLNFHPENFSKQVLYYLFVFSGFPGILYLAANGRIRIKRGTWAHAWSNVGIWYLVAALTIVSLVALFSPVVPYLIARPDDAGREVLFSLFDIAILTGLVCLFDNVDRTRALGRDSKILDGFDARAPRFSRYQIHALAWTMGIVGFIAFLAVFLVAGGQFDLRISVWLLISRTWSFAFIVAFSLFLINAGQHGMRKRMAIAPESAVDGGM